MGRERGPEGESESESERGSCRYIINELLEQNLFVTPFYVLIFCSFLSSPSHFTLIILCRLTLFYQQYIGLVQLQVFNYTRVHCNSRWRHQKKTFSRYWPFVRGIHRPPVNSPHKGQWRGALMFSLVCVSINSSANNREADYLRRHLVHYDVIVKYSHMQGTGSCRWCPNDFNCSHWSFFTVRCAHVHCTLKSAPLLKY